jgi:hypothetical protein
LLRSILMRIMYVQEFDDAGAGVRERLLSG